ncbi:MAG: S9 family peptidase [Brumimicrobium sp.]|nr:S9 family peptidase [Brumimicrobium sp.]
MSKIFILTLSGIILLGCTESKTTMTKKRLEEPKAEKIAYEFYDHGDLRVDNYFWMRLSDEQKEAVNPDEQTRKVVAYLEAENSYLKESMKHTEALQEKLYREIVARIEQKDESVPVEKKGYLYYQKYEEGEDYPLYIRKEVKESAAKEEIMLEGPKMAKGHAYFSIGGQSVSPDNNFLVYGVDTVSRRQYTLAVKDLRSGKILKDVIPNTTGGAVWANDNKTLFYTRKDPVTLRSYRVYKHVLGTDPDKDELVFEEKDETFSCDVKKSKSDKYIMIGSYQTLSSEVRVLDADNPSGSWKIIQPRERNLEYSIAHYGDHFYIVTNLDAKNFRLMKTPLNATEKSNWKEVIPHRKDVLVEDIEIFKNFLVVEERAKGLTRIRIMPWGGKNEHYISFDEPAYTVSAMQNPEFDTEKLRFAYTSLTTPNSVYDYNMQSRERELKKQTKVLDPSFSPDNYVSERMFATASDGAQVPISLVYRKGLKKDGSNPLLLYGYGSYGYSMDPYFSSVRLSLLDRGFVFAIAHIRGGEEMGREWYENGKLLQKKNTFTDFIQCGEHLIAQKFTSKEHLYAQGGSAGGLLMGAVMNMRPDLWNGIIAGVPFVDVVSTMLDESIPLTTGEFDEWGNPKDKVYYDYMKSYSPYDNIKRTDYPHLLITTGYWDSQVQYWEPAKWIAKLRELRTNDNRLYMYCNMDVGHGGASGRFERYKETALEYAFLLDLEGKD